MLQPEATCFQQHFTNTTANCQQTSIHSLATSLTSRQLKCLQYKHENSVQLPTVGYEQGITFNPLTTGAKRLSYEQQQHHQKHLNNNVALHSLFENSNLAHKEQRNAVATSAIWPYKVKESIHAQQQLETGVAQKPCLVSSQQQKQQQQQQLLQKAQIFATPQQNSLSIDTSIEYLSNMLPHFQRQQQHSHLGKFYHKITNENEKLDFNSRRRRGRLRLLQQQQEQQEQKQLQLQLTQQQQLQTDINRPTQPMSSQQSLKEKYKAFYNVPAAMYLNNVANVITALLLTQMLSFIKQINSFVNKPQQQKQQQQQKQKPSNNLVLSLISKIHNEIIYNNNNNKQISTGKRKISPKPNKPNANATATVTVNATATATANTTLTTPPTTSLATTFLLYAFIIITILLILPCHHPNALADAAKPKSATQLNTNNNRLQHQHQQDKPLIAYAAGADNVHIDKEGSILTPPSYQIVSSQTSNEEETDYILDSDERNFDLENESINEVNEEERESYEKFDNGK